SLGANLHARNMPRNQAVQRTDIVSDIPDAGVNDETLVNAWGLAFNPKGIAWISSNEEGISEVYDEEANHVIPSVMIPGVPDAGSPSAPTGQVFNADSSSFDGDRFIFVTEDGVISGWQPPSDGGASATATLRVNNSASGANYKGVTLLSACNHPAHLYAANFSGSVDVFDASYAPVTTTGGFVDPNMPAGFAPFNVQAFRGMLIVTYALRNDEGDDEAGPGNGFVNLFDSEGSLIQRLISQGALNSPWGVAVTPAHFGRIPHRLLIGNFGDGIVNIYRVMGPALHRRAVHEGTLVDTQGKTLVIDGLWALAFGPGTGGFESDELYFTAGPNDEAQGVFGELKIPEVK
ncbi:MAG TPA: TIGR03118 family protein, partial [Polyangiaceae bacterium]|nr:TIGR03118 family protein [Polyangiaceae bacterium]